MKVFEVEMNGERKRRKWRRQASGKRGDVAVAVLVLRYLRSLPRLILVAHGLECSIVYLRVKKGTRVGDLLGPMRRCD